MEGAGLKDLPLIRGWQCHLENCLAILPRQFFHDIGVEMVLDCTEQDAQDVSGWWDIH